VLFRLVTGAAINSVIVGPIPAQVSGRVDLTHGQTGATQRVMNFIESQVTDRSSRPGRFGITNRSFTTRTPRRSQSCVTRQCVG
jgi:hypothetical protein